MKVFKKSIGVILVLAMICALCAAFSSCKKDEPQNNLVATYKGGEIYENDLADWQTYYLNKNVDEIISAGAEKTSPEEVSAAMEQKRNEILDKTTDYVVQVKIVKSYIQENKIAEISDQTIKNYAEKMKSEIEDQYKDNGGYEYWRDVVCGKVSDNFIIQMSEADIVMNYVERCAMELSPVTDELIMDYWRLHQSEYIVTPSYKFEALIVPIADGSNGGEADWAAAKAEAQGYIDRLTAGESFETVKEDALNNSKNPNISKFYSVSDSVDAIEADYFINTEERLAEVEAMIKAVTDQGLEFVEYADPKGNKDEYELWYYYCGLMNQLYTKHYAATLGIGEVNPEPFLFVNGYEIIKITEHISEAYFLNPETNENVYNEIYNTLYNELWEDGSGSSVDAFMEKLYLDYDVKTVYRYSQN